VTDSLRPALCDIADQLQLTLTESQLDLLLAYLGLLVRWNATYNLTAVRAPADMVTQHLADCLAIVRPLSACIGDAKDARILDVGSGAGLPGLILAATMPQVTVLCLDKVGKKVAFIRHALAELGLRNLLAEHARVEALAAGKFDVIISRAFSSLADFVALTRPHLAQNGVWLAMKGKTPTEELLEVQSQALLFHVEPVHVPGTEAQRCLVWMRQRQ
jgi:16S rRNA (guanine527-N7)-methyltransferase